VPAPTLGGKLRLAYEVNSVTGLTDGAAIAAVPDTSGNAHPDAAQTTASKQPIARQVTLGGKTFWCAEFNGSAHALDLSGSTLTLATNIGELTAFAVLIDIATGTGSKYAWALSTASSSNVRASLRRSSDTTINVSGRRLDADTFTHAPYSSHVTGTWYAYTSIARWSSSDALIYRDGTAVMTELAWLTDGNTDITDSADGSLGATASSGSLYFTGQIAAWLFYVGALTDAERAQVHTYIQDTYGITVSDYTSSAPAADLTAAASLTAGATLTTTATVDLTAAASLTSDATVLGSSVTLRPNGDGTATTMAAPTGAATHWDAVDDDPDAHDGDATYTSSGTGAGSVFLLLTDTPTDFASMKTLTGKVAVRVDGAVSNDTMSLTAQVFAADETTTLSDAVTVADQTVGATYVVRSLTFTPTASDKATWDGARLKLSWAYTKAGPADGFTMPVTAVELEGTYTATATVVSGAAALTAPASLVAAGLADYQGAAPLTAAASLSAAAVQTMQAAVDLSAAAALTAADTVTTEAAASLAAPAALTAAPTLTVPAAATLTAPASLTATGTLTQPAAADLTAAASLTAGGDVTALGAASLTAPATLEATPGGDVAGAAALTAPASLTAGAVHEQVAAAALTAPAALTAAPVQTHAAAAALTAEAVLDASTTGLVEGAAALTAPAAVAAGAAITALGTAALTAPADLTAAAAVTRAAAVDLLAPAVLVPAGLAELAAAANLQALATLTATAEVYNPAGPTPPERVLVIPFEDRVLIVATEDRTRVVPAETRILTA
jgi:hypothetical protein